MPRRSKRWRFCGNIKKWFASCKVKDKIDKGLQRRKGAHEHGEIRSYHPDMGHEGQSHMDHRPTSTPFDDTSTLSHEASTMTIGSDFRTAALQPSLSMIPNLQQAPYARSTHLDLENFDPSTIPSSQSAVKHHDRGQTKRIDCYDSSHSESCGSSQQSQKKAEEQKKNCEIAAEIYSGTGPDAVSIEQDKLCTQIVVDEAEVSVDASPSSSGTVLSRAGSLVGVDGREPATCSHTLQSSELSPPLTIRNLVDFEIAEEARRAESSTSAVGSSILSRTPSQITDVSRTSSRQSGPAVKTQSQSHQRYKAQNSRLEQLLNYEAQVFEERRKEIRQFMEDEALRASLDTDLSTGLYQQPSGNTTSLRNIIGQSYTHRRSTLSLPALRGSMSCATLPGMSMESLQNPPSPSRAEVHYAQSMQNLCSAGMRPVQCDSQFRWSTADHPHDQFSERSTSRARIDARSISSKSFVDTGDQTSIRSHHSSSPSTASSFHRVQQRPPPNPSPRHLRYPGGPTPVDVRNSTAMDSQSSGSDPYSRPFTGFSGVYAHSQRPHSAIYPASSYQPEAEPINRDPYAQFARDYPRQLDHPHYSQPTPNFARPASIASTSSYTHGSNLNPYVPPGGPLVADVMIPSAPPRGQMRSPKGIPKLQCAANVNMAVSWDANGDPIGYHYENPKDSVIERWQGAVQASAELKKLRSARVKSKNGRGEGQLANWRSPGRIHDTIHEEETFRPDERGLYGYVSRGQAEGRLKGNGMSSSLTSTSTTPTSTTDTSNYQKQIANRRALVYPPRNQHLPSQSQLGQLGLQYSHIEREKARRLEKEKQQEKERKARGRKDREEMKKQR
ncbi:hypothetical protein BLS_004905 [Venturia inaequalis]|uniref:Uncharacterized protein n=2 Tax=Venturia inaequalis TaxID=5025 RepID=A0A8H3UKQ3_VENIN|nr:hypothetical protein BLS_004905 [Venturia inaequalis]